MILNIKEKAMRDYGVIYSKIWTDAKFRKFTDAEKTLFVYLLTCEHSNLLGCYRLPVAYIADDLNWDVKKAKDTVSTLCRHGVITVDAGCSWVFIPRYLQYNPLANESCGKRLVKLFESVPPECSFLVDLIKVLKENSRYLPLEFIHGLDTVSTRCRHPVDISISISNSISNSITEDILSSCSELKKFDSEPQASQTPAVITLPLNTGEDFSIFQPQVDDWAELYPGVDVLQTLRTAKAWCIANPTRRKTKRGVLKFLNAWLTREQDKPKFNKTSEAIYGNNRSAQTQQRDSRDEAYRKLAQWQRKRNEEAEAEAIGVD